MIVMFTARRLKPGAWDQFREAWAQPPDDAPPGFVRAYTARNLRDEDEVISFGLFDMSEADYRRWREEADAQETQRVDRLSTFVENEPVSGVYEVAEELEPDLGAFVRPDDRFVLEQFSVPVVHVSNGSISVGELLERRAAFAAVVFEGLVLHDLAIGGEPALRILGPGDVISLPDGPGPSLLRTSRYRARASTRLALLGNDFLAAARRVPTVLVGLRAAEAGQVERLAAQLVICQMPRVADRVQA